ncbi:MAG: flagellar motor switch protein FliN [Solirubrobacterales bacterium]|nr:flagellar motor switch protein FliN [Solirubrobacterales bacterium]
MTETIEYEQFEQNGEGGPPTLPTPPTSSARSAPDSAAGTDLSRLSDIPMELSVEIGRTHMTVGETLDLRVGSVVTLERLAGETADLLVNGSAIARGEVVVIDEQYGLRVTEILDAESEHEPTTSDELALGDGQAGQAAGGAPTPAAAAPADAEGSSSDEG